MGTRRFAVWSCQRPGLTVFGAKLQRQPPKLFQQQPFLRATATDIQQYAVLREPRILAASFVQSTSDPVLLIPADILRT